MTWHFKLLTVEVHTVLQATWTTCCSPLFLQTMGPWFPNTVHKLCQSGKKSLDHWGTLQFFFSFIHIRNFRCCSWFRSGLTCDTCSTFSGHICACWILMHWLLPKFLNPFCSTILSRLLSSLLLLHLYLPHFYLPVNFPWICFDIALCEQPALLTMTLCGLPSVSVSSTTV